MPEVVMDLNEAGSVDAGSSVGAAQWVAVLS